MSKQVPLFQLPIHIENIMKIVPQRYPYLFLDRVLELEPGVSAVGLKNVTINENFFQGHFPEEPIMPGVMIVEGASQLAGMINAAQLLQENPAQTDFSSAVGKICALKDVKFRTKVKPGDQLILKTKVVERDGDKTRFDFVAEVDGQVVAEGQVTLRSKKSKSEVIEHESASVR